MPDATIQETNVTDTYVEGAARKTAVRLTTGQSVRMPAKTKIAYEH